MEAELFFALLSSDSPAEDNSEEKEDGPGVQSLWWRSGTGHGIGSGGDKMAPRSLLVLR